MKCLSIFRKRRGRGAILECLCIFRKRRGRGAKLECLCIFRKRRGRGAKLECLCIFRKRRGRGGQIRMPMLIANSVIVDIIPPRSGRALFWSCDKVQKHTKQKCVRVGTGYIYLYIGYVYIGRVCIAHL